jgi:peptidylprolyl isomerase domain and WD repeat-containing protein 1
MGFIEVPIAFPPPLIQVLEFEKQYLDALPSGQMYERSYMHRDTVTHVVVSVRSSAPSLPLSFSPRCARAHAHTSAHTPLPDTRTEQATSSDFFISGSIDGYVKFWKKQPIGIEFVKTYRAHLGPVDGESRH